MICFTLRRAFDDEARRVAHKPKRRYDHTRRDDYERSCEIHVDTESVIEVIIVVNVICFQNGGVHNTKSLKPNQKQKKGETFKTEPNSQ